ncbi:MAG: hypothetical protein H7Y13_08665 [Sphingobacteriaceae bacterium]|nr:hypothetical protein [Sphingobacteriaceae bacterium]
MGTHIDKTPENKNQSIPAGLPIQSANSKSTFQLQDNRTEATVQKKQVKALASRQLSGSPMQTKSNRTALPDNLKLGIEMKSGVGPNNDMKLEREVDSTGRSSLTNVAQLAASKKPYLGPSDTAPVQLVGLGGLLRWGGVGLATLSVGALALGAMPLGLGLAGLAIGGAAALGGMAMGDDRHRSPNYGTRPRSNTPTDKDWYANRSKTAYGYTTGLSRHQGPHTFPHIGKVVAAEHAIETNPQFDPVAISERTGAIPSAGQQRRLVREYEEATSSTIPDARKSAHDKAYKEALTRRDTGTHEERVAATRDAMELSALTTYSLHQKASHDEIKGKGERRKTVTPDLEEMAKMKRGDALPKLAKVDIPKNPSHKVSHLTKLARDMGQIFKGNDDLSELELSSDDEYS